MTYRVIYSDRRRLGMEVRNGELIVRAPRGTSRRRIEGFVADQADWIEKALAKSQARQREAETAGLLTEEEIRALKKEGKKVFPERVALYAPLVGVTYGQIRVGCQRSLWGSCTRNGDLSFNCLLLLAPLEVLDSVVVHELCHRKYMNHSGEFYREVRRAYPEYDRWNRWLKEHGPVLQARVKRAD